MTLFLAGHPITSIVFDFDQTLYPDNDPQLESQIFGEIKRQAAIQILAQKGINHPTKNQINIMRDEYDSRGMKEGWSVAFAHLGGDPQWFNKTVRSAPKAPYLRKDDSLDLLFETLRNVANVYIFSGATHTSVEDSLAVLIGTQYKKYITDIVADDDLPDGIEKPHPDAYQQFVAMKNIDPEQTIMLDDQPSEILTAMSLHMHAILVGARHTQEVRSKFPHHIERVHQLLNLLTFP